MPGKRSGVLSCSGFRVRGVFFSFVAATKAATLMGPGGAVPDGNERRKSRFGTSKIAVGPGDVGFLPPSPGQRSSTDIFFSAVAGLWTFPTSSGVEERRADALICFSTNPRP
jgi:hypothetical protein